MDGTLTAPAPQAAATTHQLKFRRLLEELFMFDQADLDFGIYRIMNAKRDEITRFLDEDLLPQVRAALGAAQGGERVEVEAELKQLERTLRDAGIDPEQSPKVKELRERFGEEPDAAALEAEVFSQLYTFFRRYYHEGDFISQRRYKAGVYAIPYEGEEVKLHWANHDQYYIKTGENFRDYTFTLPDGRRVHFKLAEADTERNNNKAAEGQERRFVLVEDEPVVEEDGELVIRFTYQPDAAKRRQAALNEEAVKRARAEAPAAWRTALETKAPTERDPSRTLFEKHLADYTARNTFDYFIHKDLGGFLRRELDFFIKNEIVHLDDLEHESAPRVEQYLGKVRALRRIAQPIIDFLAQLEDFQKKLWLKKKFVVETNYCITLDRVPEELYPEIAANDAQREEWVRLFAVNEFKQDLSRPGYSTPLTVEFLKANPFLVLDTALFGEGLKDRLLASIEDLDEQTDGLLVHGENFQALSLLEARYTEGIQCIYIDPPFNTESDQFLYKDGYRAASWISFMSDRLALARDFLDQEGTIYTHIDHNSNYVLRILLGKIFGEQNFLNEIIWRIGWVSGYKTAAPRYVRNHETIFLYAKGSRYRFNKEHARIPYKSLETKALSDEINVLRASFGLADRRDTRLSSIVFKDSQDRVYKSGLTTKSGRYNVEDTWNSNVYEDLDSNKIKRNVAEYTPNGSYLTQKPEKLLQRIVEVSSSEGDTLLDFFGGSGTTAAVALKLRRRFVTVEAGDYFDSDLLHRLKLVLGGRRVGISSQVSYRGGGLIKYTRLESYEDTLNNLHMRRRPAQQELLDENEDFRSDYLLHYMLDVESAGSASLLNLEQFEDPFSYELKIGTGSAGETRPTRVDLVETFNYLLGLRIKHIDRIRGIRVVEGTSPEGERVLVIWRNTKEVSNADLDAFFQKQEYNTRDTEFDVIYVNGGNNLENLRRADETWKVRLIEEEFFGRMFDVRDV